MKILQGGCNRTASGKGLWILTSVGMQFVGYRQSFLKGCPIFKGVPEYDAIGRSRGIEIQISNPHIGLYGCQMAAVYSDRFDLISSSEEPLMEK